MQWVDDLRRYDFGERTVLSLKLRSLAATLKTRSVVVVLSDLHDPNVISALELLVAAHAVIVFWLQDPAEVKLPAGGFFVRGKRQKRGQRRYSAAAHARRLMLEFANRW